MQTTAMLAEILVIGLLTLCAFVIALAGFFGVDQDQFTKIAASAKDYMPILIMIVLALAYQLGWLTNAIAHYLAKYTYMKNIRSNVLGKRANDYGLMRDTIYADASENAVNKIKERLFGVRLSRTGVINFSLTAFALVIIHQYWLALFAMLLTFAFCISAYHAYRDYVERVFNIYRRIEEGRRTSA